MKDIASVIRSAGYTMVEVADMLETKPAVLKKQLATNKAYKPLMKISKLLSIPMIAFFADEFPGYVTEHVRETFSDEEVYNLKEVEAMFLDLQSAESMKVRQMPMMSLFDDEVLCA